MDNFLVLLHLFELGDELNMSVPNSIGPLHIAIVEFV